MAITLFNPRSDAEFAARDALLTLALRDGAGGYPIAREYPLVLAKEAAAFSWCAALNGSVVAAHANLFPREVFAPDGARVKVGLIGNVATAPSLRGKGVMTELFRELERVAVEMGLEAVLLWSDLNEFYQKLGFRPTGRELRFTLRRDDLSARVRALAAEFTPLSPADRAKISAPRLAALMSARFPSVATLARTPDEFRRQLAIPEMTFVVRDAAADAGPSYAVTGKGHDMGGVAHEWGGPTPNHVLAAVLRTMDELGLDAMMLLMPCAAPANWHQAFVARAADVEEHPMAWLKPLRPNDPKVHLTLANAFVWGLDSI